jgi:tetratricopeptide (TPR) repeat protein
MRRIQDYLISYDPQPTQGLLKLSQEERHEYDRLYEQALRAPKELLPAILEFRQKHSDLPEIENLLAVVHLYLREIDKVEKLIEESYKKFPSYLFARINYADQCLRKKKPQLVPGIFDHHFELSSLYPEKESFHISEFRGFMVLMGLYFLSIREKDKAEKYYHLALEADPQHPSVRLLEKKLFRQPFLKRVARFLKIK